MKFSFEYLVLLLFLKPRLTEATSLRGASWTEAEEMRELIAMSTASAKSGAGGAGGGSMMTTDRSQRMGESGGVIPVTTPAPTPKPTSKPTPRPNGGGSALTCPSPASEIYWQTGPQGINDSGAPFQICRSNDDCIGIEFPHGFTSTPPPVCCIHPYCVCGPVPAVGVYGTAVCLDD
jgi:hypothetical protein